MHFRADDLSVDWFTSSYSNDQGGECVEAGRMRDGSMAIRDSKEPHGSAFVFSAATWDAFVTAAKDDCFSNV
ncbi:DUF397 domain-containing protein [Streptomyces longispororuber]|uniref:DUF397 domain-containing protein n=1 Tax=Streptomyces longispororuber TaxID=68230 RepID=UPI0033D677E1